MPAHGHKRTGIVRSVEEIRAQRAIDAHSAGWRRGYEGRAPGGTYAHRDEFKLGYAEGCAARAAEASA